MGENRLIRASEIGEYVYCRRAWWFHRVRGIDPQNVEELSRGMAVHRAHGRAVMYGEIARRAALILIALALLLAAIWLVVSVGAI